MAKKGKFKLLSYVIEDNLIFYQSLNHKKKLLAFSLIKVKSFYPLIVIANNLLKKRIIKYYSIQISVQNNNEIVFILFFEGKVKDEIIKLYNMISHEFNKHYENYYILINEDLEETFLDILNIPLTQNISVLRKNDSLMLKNHKSLSINYFYILNLNKIQNKNSFIHNFLSFTKGINSKGFLIFNLKMDQEDQIVIGCFFVEQYDKFHINDHFLKNVNDFYKNDLLIKQELNFNNIFGILWRYGISKNIFSFSIS